MQWISVKDKMPDKDDRYLVYVQYQTCGDWIGVSSLRNGEFDDRLATHWMDLPEAPQGSK